MSFFKQGISLVEFLVVITIVVILGHLASPLYKNMMASWERRQVTATLALIIAEAKLYALTHHQRVAICGTQDGLVCHSAGWQQGILVFVDKQANRLRDRDELILKYHQFSLSYGVLNWRGFGLSNHLIFQENGLPRGSQGSFYYCSKIDSQHRRVLMSSLGRVRFEDIKTC